MSNEVTITLSYDQAEALLALLKAVSAINHGDWYQVRKEVSKKLRGENV